MQNIWVAAADNKQDIVKQYVESGNFAADAKDPNGYTPIHAAASYGHTELLKYLTEKGGDINVQDNEGDTPLHHVEDVETAKLVIDLGGDYRLKNGDGLTAAEYIEEDDEFPDVVQYLRGLVHGLTDNVKSRDDEAAAAASAAAESTDFIGSLPVPGNVDGHEIRYTMEDEQADETLTPEELEERRKKIAAILDGDNPEEALRDLVRNAVKEGLSNFKAESADVNEQNDEPAKKRR